MNGLNRIFRTNLIILCGLPGSGKTTLARKIVKENGLYNISFDEMGCILHRSLIPHIKTALINGESVIVDSTYHLKRVRKELLESLTGLEVKKTIIFLDVSLDECIRRNEQRGLTVSNCLIERIHRMMQPPTLDEGWDEIIEVNNESYFTSNQSSASQQSLRLEAE